tara:strand:+ start:9 stop:542 length:534 start_codon:yes stop_codon:yes gene_type:complete
MNKTIKDNLLRYFWLILSVDIVSMFLTSEITSDIQKHNFLENIKEESDKIIKKKRKKIRLDGEEKERKQIIKEKNQLPGKKSSSLEEIRKNRSKEKVNTNLNVERDHDKNKINDNEEEDNIQETQDLLDQIDKNVIEDSKPKKNVKFNIPDDAKSEISDGSDLDLDLESFEKSLLED